jgi:hypothetical protein
MTILARELTLRTITTEPVEWNWPTPEIAVPAHCPLEVDARDPPKLVRRIPRGMGNLHGAPRENAQRSENTLSFE